MCISACLAHSKSDDDTLFTHADLQALEAAQVKSGQRVLIHGGSGGVGSAGVQIAKAWGAHVTSTCSTKNMQLVKVWEPLMCFMLPTAVCVTMPQQGCCC